MSRRIEIELTSRAADGSWTWRAAGAKQPRGTLDASLSPGDAAVGAVYRAEVESGLDGIEVIALGAAKAPSVSPAAGNRIEVVGPARREPGVSVTLLAGSRGGRDGDRSRRRDRDGDGDTRGRGDRRGRDSRGRDRDSRDRDGRDNGRDRDGRDRGERGERDEGDRSRRPAGQGAARGPRREGDDRRSRDAAPAGDRRPKRPAVSTTHRNALLAALRPEQLPVAEQLLRGGIPAVRQAIDEQNAAARSTGSPPASSDALLAMAEDLLGPVRLAEWKDRATTAINAGRELRLRELRTVVTGSRTVNLDEEGRGMAKALSESLEARVTALRQEWVARVESLIAQDKVAEALEVSAHPPEHGTRCPAELAVALADAAGRAMNAELDPLAWQSLLEAVMESPVRRTVKPTGIPDDEHALTAARHAAGAVPELAKLLGLRIPPPPPRRTVVRRNLTPAPTGGRSGGAAAGPRPSESHDPHETHDAHETQDVEVREASDA